MSAVLDFNPPSTSSETCVRKHSEPEMCKAESVSALAHGICHFAQTDGDYTTAVPALTLQA